MTRVFAAAALIIGTLAAIAEISSFLMDKGGVIRDLMRPPEAAQPPPACRRDANPLVKMLCEDKRDGAIRLER
jgi:hypothetical protein